MSDKPSEQQNDARGDARSSRLVVRKTMEEEYRNKYYEIARETCHDFIRDFATCAKEQNMMVVLNCRELSKKMNACLDAESSETGFIKFMDKRGYDYITVESPGLVFGTSERKCFMRRLDNSKSSIVDSAIKAAAAK